MKISYTLKNARLNNDYTQEQVAEYIFVSRQTISNWENGKSLPDIISIIKISDLYGLSLDELLKGDQAMLKKIERDAEAVKAEKKLFRFAWIAIMVGLILFILGEVFKGNPLIDFINGALPWVLFGLLILFAFFYLNKDENLS